MAVRLIIAVMLAGVVAVPSMASAQHGDITDDVRFEEELDPNEFMITGRMRAVRAPNFVLGMFFEEHASHWSDGQRNMSWGGEFVWRRGTDFELGVAFDYADLSMPEDFWKQEGDQAREADWTEIDLQVYSVMFSAYWFWEVEPWLTPYFGGGLGLGFTGGDIMYYDPDPNYDHCYGELGGGENTSFAPPACYENQEEAIDRNNPEIEDDLWPVYPMVNLTTGLRFNIREHGVLKLEAGMYPYLFAGMGFGAQF